ncbi:hypothetical protein LP416_30150 [Polaromonas sp. P2-4]|nr:hypothetical protein LP416_30150 [Polaromonas sp. P2-4]
MLFLQQLAQPLQHFPVYGIERWICRQTIQQARLLELAQIVYRVKHVMRCALHTARHGYPRGSEHLVESSAAMPGFHGVQNKFTAVFCTNDSGHACYLIELFTIHDSIPVIAGAAAAIHDCA